MNYSSQEVMARASITYRQLDHWTSQGYLAPESAHPGQGRQREFSAEQLSHAIRLSELTKAGFTLSVAHRLAQEIAVWPVVKLPGTSLIIHSENTEETS